MFNDVGCRIECFAPRHYGAWISAVEVVLLRSLGRRPLRMVRVMDKWRPHCPLEGELVVAVDDHLEVLDDYDKEWWMCRSTRTNMMGWVMPECVVSLDLPPEPPPRPPVSSPRPLSLVVLDMGSGTRLPRVRTETEAVLRDVNRRSGPDASPRCLLVRINTEEPQADDPKLSGVVSLRMGAEEALKRIDAHLVPKIAARANSTAAS
eukprot:NODE_2139_length_979_cov_22.758065_g1754_i0.p1 GENE.NODE_2139_length_979_cov_22.758065_g1754_i0~~NODE_2139_length_979_cov_22.758065_g1754_i0.p1  ORF type:complete len:206 (-),score=48.81 NODE_2139_length_979_cov_22.758065_g1754_i0:54-671(-)